jgi:hypothetical protein
MIYKAPITHPLMVLRDSSTTTLLMITSLIKVVVFTVNLPHNNYQSLSGHERSLITVNGEAVVEMDIHACALSITHALFKIPLPDRSDLYHLEGVERDVVKSWINLSLTNGKPLERWPETVIEDFKKQ